MLYYLFFNRIYCLLYQYTSYVSISNVYDIQCTGKCERKERKVDDIQKVIFKN